MCRQNPRKNSSPVRVVGLTCDSPSGPDGKKVVTLTSRELLEVGFQTEPQWGSNVINNVNSKL